MSLVSVWARNRTQTVEIGEAVENTEIIEIASMHAGFAHIAEKMIGYKNGRGEYPTLSAMNLDFLRRPASQKASS